MRLYVLLATVIAATLVATGNALTDAQDESKITALRKATTTADIATADSLAEAWFGHKRNLKVKKTWPQKNVVVAVGLEEAKMTKMKTATMTATTNAANAAAAVVISLFFEMTSAVGTVDRC
ncbi:hypothetical protein GQ600_18363 [Phytophthora cactorum]|nr:hypothetical protein GQ600_18363 [Phytophthora cactorum]